MHTVHNTTHRRKTPVTIILALSRVTGPVRLRLRTIWSAVSRASAIAARSTTCKGKSRASEGLGRDASDGVSDDAGDNRVGVGT